MDITGIISSETSIPYHQVSNALALFAEGATIPFVARYRKERTGGLDETQLRAIQDRHRYLTELQERKETILQSIAEQGKLTDDLKQAIENTLQKAELEDLYLPYKPRRRTRATVAREKGLEPLAEWIKEQNQAGVTGPVDWAAAVSPFIDAEKEINTIEDALQGASDIIAEEIAERADLRAFTREYMLTKGVFTSKIKEDYPEGTTQYEMYRDYSVPVSEIAAHNMLALRRGESEGILTLTLEFEEAVVLSHMENEVISSPDPEIQSFYRSVIDDAFKRLMKHTLIGEIRMLKKQEADEASAATFAANLRELLLASPAGMRPTLGVDTGFRTGCKVAALDHTGRLLEYQTIFPHTSAERREEAARILTFLIQKHHIELIAVGNGTAGRETEQFIKEVISRHDRQPVVVMVSEAGASVYSASEVAKEEFPDLDLTVRGAASIGRRLQDPLAELVKIDPKSIGVGQYQHDIDQDLLRRKLDETVESCVNYVGVDLNTASKELLQYVAGLTPSLSRNIVDYRNRHGAFKDRREILNVERFGPKAFEQSAGFLRIRGGNNPLDNTAVHPESYPIVERMAADLGIDTASITRVPDRLKEIDLKKYVTADAGEPTLRDILAELEKPGRDPREEFRYATFREDVTTIEDLKPGMILEGVVTNVANFGAFVDVGVHRDGLVHVSQLADRFVKDPAEVVRVGQVVKVRVVEVDQSLKRISLSMRLEDKPTSAHSEKQKPSKHKSSETPRYSIEDLKRKFNSR